MYIFISADINDGDYVGELSKINPDELDKIKLMVEAIKNFKPYKVKSKDPSWNHEWTHTHNFSHGDFVRENHGEKSAEEYYVKSGIVSQETFITFLKYCPFCEHGFHTVNEVKFFNESPIVLL